MTDGTHEQALKTAIKHTTDLLSENWVDAMKACGKAAIEASKHGKDKFKYALRLTVWIEPRGQEANISAGIAFGLTQRETTEPSTVHDTPLLDRAGVRV